VPSEDERMGARKIFEGAVWRLGQMGQLGQLGQLGRDFSAATSCCECVALCGGFIASRASGAGLLSHAICRFQVTRPPLS
jgi:hypothetical protein